MGRGSRNYALYYAFSSLAYLSLSIATFVALSTVTYTCKERCPLLLADTNPKTNMPLYSDCQCGSLGAFGLGGDKTNPSSISEQTDRYTKVVALTTNTAACYICIEENQDSVYEACDEFDSCTKEGMLGFRPASISSEMLCTTNSSTSTVHASALVSNTVVNRKYVNTMLYFLAVLMLFLGLASGLCTWGFASFVHKYEDDWVKLSFYETVLGSLCKAMPILSRLVNIVMFFVVLMGVVIVFGYEVCYHDVNQFGDPAFREVVSGILMAISVFWLFMCTCGTLFNRWIPRDTPFYTPKFPTDKDDSKSFRCLAGTWSAVIRNGP